ncbi:hydrolase, partial [Gemmatimonadota bacterium]
ARLIRSRLGGVVLRRERLTLPDGDFLDLDWASCVEGREIGQESALVMVVHGLEGSAQSGYSKELYRSLGRRGIPTVGMNFRSCSGEINRLPRLYHSGETGDLAFVLGKLKERFPGRALGVVGVSLGGNVLLKYLGEGGEQAREDVTAAAAISVPFDLSAGADYMERGFSRVYRWSLVGRLKRKVRAKASTLSELIDVERTLESRTFREFDDSSTAPLHGFHGADDYYKRSSSSAYVDKIRVPTMLIHSFDDPFLPAGAVPQEAALGNPYIECRFTEHGGHVGFVEGPPWAPVFWAEQTAASFLAGRL